MAFDDESYNMTTRLLQLVVEKQTSDAISRCKAMPEEASQWQVRKDDKEVTWMRLPIHEACIRKPKVSLVEALLDAYPMGAQQEDHTGRLPLHHAW